MHRHATAPAITEPDLSNCALVRLGSEAHVQRLQRIGAKVLDRGASLSALVIASDESGASDREGVLDGVGWVLLAWRRRQVLVVLMPDEDER